jgi:hypothetical protein
MKNLIASSYDARPATDALSWASIQARTPKRRRRLRLPVLFLSLALIGVGVTVTGSSDPYRLPPVDFDVALAPNYDGNAIAPEDEIAPNGGFVGAKLPGADFRVMATTNCHITPGSQSALAGDFPAIADYRAVTSQDFISLCVESLYSIDWYRDRVLGVSATAGELRGGKTGSIVLPDVFAVCVDGVNTAEVHVVPGFAGITDMSRACQDLAMHPFDTHGELRPSYVVSRASDAYDAWVKDYQGWLARALKVESDYPGFRHFD